MLVLTGIVSTHLSTSYLLCYSKAREPERRKHTSAREARTKEVEEAGVCGGYDLSERDDDIEERRPLTGSPGSLFMLSV